MNLKDKLQEDLKSALKAGEATRTGVVRLLIAAANNKAIDKRGKTGSDQLTDDEVVQVLTSEAKKRKESIEVFTAGGRADLADKEKAELEIIQKYLPKQMTPAETEQAVDEILRKTGAKEIGPAMKAVIAELRGRADAGMVSQIVKEKLQK